MILPSIAYPLVSHRLVHDNMGGVPLTTLLLGTPATVPWLNQTVYLPLCRAIRGNVADRNVAKLRSRLLDHGRLQKRIMPTVATSSRRGERRGYATTASECSRGGVANRLAEFEAGASRHAEALSAGGSNSRAGLRNRGRACQGSTQSKLQYYS